MGPIDRVIPFRRIHPFQPFGRGKTMLSKPKLDSYLMFENTMYSVNTHKLIMMNYLIALNIYKFIDAYTINCVTTYHLFVFVRCPIPIITHSVRRACVRHCVLCVRSRCMSDVVEFELNLVERRQDKTHEEKEQWKQRIYSKRNVH